MTDEAEEYVRKRHEEFGLETYYAKIWGYDESGEEWEVTEGDMTLEQVIAFQRTGR